MPHLICPGVTAGIRPGASSAALTQVTRRSPDLFTVREEPQLGDPASLVTRGLKFGLWRGLHSGTTLGEPQPLWLSLSVRVCECACVCAHSILDLSLLIILCPHPSEPLPHSGTLASFSAPGALCS